MERTERANSILRQFKKKSKRILSKDYFTEFFYLNKDRKVIEFLVQDDVFIAESFFKKFIPSEFRDFVSLKIVNEDEEPIKQWYYENEGLVIVLEVNWGIKKQEISIDIDINNFLITSIDDKGLVLEEIDFDLFNEFVISFFTLQAKNLAQSFDIISRKKER